MSTREDPTDVSETSSSSNIRDENGPHFHDSEELDDEFDLIVTVDDKGKVNITRHGAVEEEKLTEEEYQDHSSDIINLNDVDIKDEDREMTLSEMLAELDKEKEKEERNAITKVKTDKVRSSGSINNTSMSMNDSQVLEIKRASLNENIKQFFKSAIQLYSNKNKINKKNKNQMKSGTTSDIQDVESIQSNQSHTLSQNDIKTDLRLKSSDHSKESTLDETYVAPPSAPSSTESMPTSATIALETSPQPTEIPVSPGGGKIRHQKTHHYPTLPSALPSAIREPPPSLLSLPPRSHSLHDSNSVALSTFNQLMNGNDINKDLSDNSITHWDILDVMRNPLGFKHFESFLAKEHSVENVQFWSAVNEYLELTVQTERMQKAKSIVEDFIEAEAPSQINLPHTTRSKILRSIHSITLSLNETTQEAREQMSPSSPLPLSATQPLSSSLTSIPLTPPTPLSLSSSLASDITDPLLPFTLAIQRAQREIVNLLRNDPFRRWKNQETLIQQLNKEICQERKEKELIVANSKAGKTDYNNVKADLYKAQGENIDDKIKVTGKKGKYRFSLRKSSFWSNREKKNILIHNVKPHIQPITPSPFALTPRSGYIQPTSATTSSRYPLPVPPIQLVPPSLSPRPQRIPIKLQLHRYNSSSYTLIKEETVISNNQYSNNNDEIKVLKDESEEKQIQIKSSNSNAGFLLSADSYYTAQTLNSKIKSD